MKPRTYHTLMLGIGAFRDTPFVGIGPIGPIGPILQKGPRSGDAVVRAAPSPLDDNAPRRHIAALR
jgi:hypothetical protein